jgi:hypothetical protein
MIMAPGGFIILGCLIAAMQYVMNRKKKGGAGVNAYEFICDFPGRHFDREFRFGEVLGICAFWAFPPRRRPPSAWG